MPTFKTDPDLNITVENGVRYFSLGSNLWTQLNGVKYKDGSTPPTYAYSPPDSDKDKFEFATMNMVDWNQDGNWSSAKMRLEMALGYGTYELSIRVGKGSGVITTFYLSKYDEDGQQEIDLEFSGHCAQPNTAENPCGTASVSTNVWKNDGKGGQDPLYPTKLWGHPMPNSPPPSPLPDNTEGWGLKVYRYRIIWEPSENEKGEIEKWVTWDIDRSGTGNNYEMIRNKNMTEYKYEEKLLYPFISFWPSKGWSPDGSPFLEGKDATAKFKLPTGRMLAECYQALFPILEVYAVKIQHDYENRLLTLGDFRHRPRLSPMAAGYSLA